MSVTTAQPIDAVRVLLARVRQDRGGFLRETDLQLLAGHPSGRLTLVLVRCGACRFLCPAQDVAHLENAIEAIGDYVRDVSLPAEGGR